MTYEDVRYDVGGDGVATLTINRPEVMNALRPQTSVEMFDVLDDVRHNDDVRCLVITGEGRGFCAGDDFQAIFLAEDRASRKNERQIRRIKQGESSLDEIFALEKPTIAAVNGAAVGYGMDIALYCDIRVASDRAKFGWFFVRRGVMGTIGGTFILRHLVGLSKAYELTLTGDLVDADEALRIGLVTKVVPSDELLTETYKLARKIAAGPPLAQQLVKRSIHLGLGHDWKALGEYQQAVGDVLWETEDHMEGVHSFIEKREPNFRGR
jgi:enoyl-CoA hydratase/carnithine racemase